MTSLMARLAPRWRHPRLGRICMCWLLLFVASGLGACSLSVATVAYPDLCAFDKAQFGVLNSDQVLNGIKDKYHVIPQKDEIGNSTGYSWRLNQTVREAGLLDNRLVSFMQRNLESGPKLGQVVAGLGAPDSFYRSATVFEGVQYEIGLEYPTQGVTVFTFGATSGIDRGAKFKTVDGGLSVLVSEDTQITEINCYIPKKSMDDYLREVYRVPPESMEMQKQRRVTWPGFGSWVPVE